MLRIHQLPGQLRLRSATLKGQNLCPKQLGAAFGKCQGVSSFMFDSRYGSLTIDYDHQLTNAKMLLRSLQRIGVFPPLGNLPLSSLPARRGSRAPSQDRQAAKPNGQRAIHIFNELSVKAGKSFGKLLAEHFATMMVQLVVKKIRPF